MPTNRNNELHLIIPQATAAQPQLKPIHSRIDGAFSFLNPTHIPFCSPTPLPSTADVLSTSTEPKTSPLQSSPLSVGAHFLWRSRDNRKGRHALIIHPTETPTHLKPPITSNPPQILRTVLRMCTEINYWDVSWWVAVLFTLGSVVWCINAFFSWLPLEIPSSEFKGEVNAAGITAFIGATIFEVGSVLLMLEAVNEKRTACFGWAVAKAFEEDEAEEIVKYCGHRHGEKLRRRKGDKFPKTDSDSDMKWQWWPSLHDLQTHYIHQLGFLACLFQFIGATIFWISGFTALPNLIDMENTRLSNGIFWTPQVIGGSGFIISSFLFMLETQTSWWKPAPATLGWHVGFWNLIGAIGFTLCGALGYAVSESGAAYQSSLATFWGSWAFLVGSLVQWYEAVQKHPVENAKS